MAVRDVCDISFCLDFDVAGGEAYPVRVYCFVCGVEGVRAYLGLGSVVGALSVEGRYFCAFIARFADVGVEYARVARHGEGQHLRRGIVDSFIGVIGDR